MSSGSHCCLLGLPQDVNQLSDSDWLKIFEQALMVILIVGRWLLPKGEGRKLTFHSTLPIKRDLRRKLTYSGELTRDQLSQLLLVYIGMAADIIEIFEAFRVSSLKRGVILILCTTDQQPVINGSQFESAYFRLICSFRPQRVDLNRNFGPSRK